MVIVITVIHIIVSIGLILVVLLQTGKGAEMGAVFGGSSATIFGSLRPSTSARALRKKRIRFDVVWSQTVSKSRPVHKLLKDSDAASIVASMSASVCAAETNSASNWLQGK